MANLVGGLIPVGVADPVGLLASLVAADHERTRRNRHLAVVSLGVLGLRHGASGRQCHQVIKVSERLVEIENDGGVVWRRDRGEIASRICIWTLVGIREQAGVVRRRATVDDVGGKEALYRVLDVLGRDG